MKKDLERTEYLIREIVDLEESALALAIWVAKEPVFTKEQAENDANWEGNQDVAQMIQEKLEKLIIRENE